MSKLGNWIGEQRKWWAFWKEHRNEFRERTRGHTIRAMTFYALALAGLIILAVVHNTVVRLPAVITILTVIGITILMFGSLAWMFKQDGTIAKDIEKKYNYNHVPTPPP